MPIRRAKISKQNSKIFNGGWAVRSHDSRWAFLFFSPRLSSRTTAMCLPGNHSGHHGSFFLIICLCLLSVNPTSFSPPLLPTHTQGQTEDLGGRQEASTFFPCASVLVLCAHGPPHACVHSSHHAASSKPPGRARRMGRSGVGLLGTTRGGSKCECFSLSLSRDVLTPSMPVTITHLLLPSHPTLLPCIFSLYCSMAMIVR